MSASLNPSESPWQVHGPLKVSANRRFLVHADGTPFFYLGDTAWELFHRLDREEADRYLEDRARKGFTVIQAVALAERDGLHIPNAYGHLPLIEDDPARPDVRGNAQRRSDRYRRVLQCWRKRIHSARPRRAAGLGAGAG